MNQLACQPIPATLTPSPAPRQGTRPGERAGALHPRDARCRAAATLAAAGLTLMAGMARAQPAAGDHTPPSPTARTTENLQPVSGEPAGVITPQRAMASYSIVDAWIRAWKEPTAADVPPDLAAAVRGAAITLRLRGEIVGRGSKVMLSGAGEEQSPDLPLVAAARAAWREAAQRLPGDNDALRQERLKAMAQEIQISLEVCEELIPMNPLAYDEVDRDLGAGLDGVAVRIAGQLEAIFPASMLVRDQSPADALAACVALASGDAALGIRSNPITQPPALVKSHQAVFYHFRPMHVAQTSMGSAGRFLHRGGRVVSPREITAGSLVDWANGLAGRLERLSVTETMDDTVANHPEAQGRICLRIPGTIWPAQGRTDPTWANSQQQTTVALALQRYADLRKEADKPASDRARNIAVRLVRDLLEHAASGAPSVESDEAWVARDLGYRKLLGDLTYEQTFSPWHAKPGTNPINRWDPVLHVDRVAGLQETSPGRKMAWDARGRLAMTLALRSDARAAEQVRDLYKQLGISNLHEAMPWIGWADLTRGTGSAEPAASALLREWRDAVYERMAPSQPPGSDAADLAGGLALPSGKSPTAQCAGTVAFLASMLASPVLTDPTERPKELSRLLNALRFLRQLTMDEYACYSAVDVEAAIWGVRRSPWDQRLDPQDTAMTLLAVCEAIDAISGMRR